MSATAAQVMSISGLPLAIARAASTSIGYIVATW
jgi:hypothetical protein